MNKPVAHFIPLIAILACLSCILSCQEDVGLGKSGKKDSGFSLPAAPANLVADEFQEVEAPATFRARFKVKGGGEFVIEVTRTWSPRGADRFYNLVKAGFYDYAPFFRVVDNFMVQFGLPAWPEVQSKWKGRNILDDHEVSSAKRSKSNRKGYVTFACGGPDTRTSQVFINFRNNSNLDPPANYSTFTPFGKVVEGMKIVDALEKSYGDMISQGNASGVNTALLQAQGLSYILKEFPLMDIIESARIE